MHRWVRRALCAAGLAGGTVLLGIGLAEAASADTGNGPVTTGESGILSGNQTGVGIKAPVNASGNQLTVIGQHNHVTSTGAASTPTTSPASSTAGGSGGSPTTSGQHGIGSGNQTAVHALAPVNVSGNQVTVIGQHNTATASGGSAATQGPSGSPTTSGQHGIGSGNQTGVTALVPVNVSGNQVTVIGQDNTLGALGGSSTGGGGTSTTSSGSPTTSGQGGLVSGNQTGITALVPVNVSGNQVTVIGQHNTLGALGGSSTGGGGTSATSSGSPTTSGQGGLVSGNQTGVTALVPVNVSGNQVTVIGQHNTASSLGGSTTGSGSGAGSTGSSTGSSTGPVTSGQDGVGSGNQTGIAVLVPIAATGNQATVLGQDNTLTSTGGSSTGGGSTGGTTGGGETTTGAGGVGSGNQTPITVQVPVDVSGNQVTVVGQGNTVTSTGGSTTGGPTTGGGTTSPPGGVVVSPPQGGSIGTALAVSAPSTGTLPSTGMPAGLLGFGLLGALLLLLGSALVRRDRLVVIQE